MAETKTFVLVHGAWHGGWCWRRVADQLTTRGHRVFSPTLTGLADRAHLLGPDVTLSTHIADVAGLLKWERLADIVLVGHSYGGMVITGVAEAAPHLIQHLVYVDAALPEDGQSMATFRGAEYAAKIADMAARGETAIPPIPASGFRVNERDAAWVDSLLTPQPLHTYTEPLARKGGVECVAARTYLYASNYAAPYFERCYRACAADPAWRTQALPSGHDIMLDLPDELTAILLNA